jgi:hypothetical protein
MNALITDYWPVRRVPKSNRLVWFPLSSTINRENSTAVAWMSIVSFTRIESDFKLMTPLKSPAYVGLYFTINFYCCIAAIFSIFGSIARRDPWLWENSTVLLALPEFFIEIV